MADIVNKITDKIKLEFSKKLTIWILVIFAVLVFSGMFLMAFINPEIGGSLVALIGVVMPIPTAAIYKYFTKAQAENELKISGSTTPDLTDNTAIQEGDKQ